MSGRKNERGLRVWFVHGTYEDGCVDVADRDGDVFTHVLPEVAQVLIDMQSELVAELEPLLSEMDRVHGPRKS